MRRFLVLAIVFQLALVIAGHYAETALASSGLLGTAISAVIGYLYARSEQPTLWGGFAGGSAIGLVSSVIAVLVALAWEQPLWALLGPGPIAVLLASAVAGGLGGGLAVWRRKGGGGAR